MAGRPSDKKLSRDLSNLLDQLGYDRSQRWERIHHWNIQTVLRDLSIKLRINTSNKRVFIGSLREGIGFCGLSDMDILQVDHRVICTEQDTYKSKQRFVLKIEESTTPPGYCLLEFTDSTKLANKLTNLTHAFVSRNDKTYMSSSLFMTKPDDDNLKVSKYMEVNTHYLARNGPSTPKYVYRPLADSLCSFFGIKPNRKIDFVRAFPCDGHSALKAWQHRPRANYWPSRKIVRRIMNLPVYVVPIGKHGTINEDMQWRISFVEAETYLVQTLNNVQVRILVLLKQVIKHYIDPKSQYITSYVLKNVVLWLAETIPQKKFRQKHLLARLEDALKFLIQAVERRNLRCYMQPERNLLANQLNSSQERQILNKLKHLLVHGRFFVAAHFLNTNAPLSVCSDILQDLILFNIASKMNICTLAMYPLQNQILFYLAPQKLYYGEEYFVYNIPVILRFLWVYGIEGVNDCRSISLYRHLVKSDHFHRNREMGREMLQSKEEILNTFSFQCMIVKIFACIPRIITIFFMFCIRILDIFINTIDPIILSITDSGFFKCTFSLIVACYVCAGLYIGDDLLNLVGFHSHKP